MLVGHKRNESTYSPGNREGFKVKFHQSISQRNLVHKNRATHALRHLSWRVCEGERFWGPHSCAVVRRRVLVPAATTRFQSNWSSCLGEVFPVLVRGTRLNIIKFLHSGFKLTDKRTDKLLHSLVFRFFLYFLALF